MSNLKRKLIFFQKSKNCLDFKTCERSFHMISIFKKKIKKLIQGPLYILIQLTKSNLRNGVLKYTKLSFLLGTSPTYFSYIHRGPA